MRIASFAVVYFDCLWSPDKANAWSISNCFPFFYGIVKAVGIFGGGGEGGGEE